MDKRPIVLHLFHKHCPDLSPNIVKDIEKGIYNWSIAFAEKKKIIRSWSDNRFKYMYVNKARSLLTLLTEYACLNIEPDESNVRSKLVKGDLEPYALAFMKPHELVPSKWEEYIDKKHKKDDNICNNKQIAKTDQFKCGKCKKRECSYYELQVRSADESSTIFVTCLNCSHRWRIG